MVVASSTLQASRSGRSLAPAAACAAGRSPLRCARCGRKRLLCVWFVLFCFVIRTAHVSSHAERGCPFEARGGDMIGLRTATPFAGVADEMLGEVRGPPRQGV